MKGASEEERVSSKIPSFSFQVIQSLFWLLAYFWHFARPSLVILLDGELKEALAGTCSFLTAPAEDQELEGGEGHRPRGLTEVGLLQVVIPQGELERTAPLLATQTKA